MTKPIDEEEMLWRIKAFLRRAQIANERKMTIGNVILDYAFYPKHGYYEYEPRYMKKEL